MSNTSDMLAKRWNQLHPDAPIEPWEPPTPPQPRAGLKKWCRGCERSKPVEDFGIDRQTSDGLAARCTLCRRQRRR